MLSEQNGLENGNDAQLSAAEKAKLLIQQKKEKEQQEAEEKKREQEQKVENIQNNLQETDTAIETTQQQKEQLEKDLEQAASNIEEAFENVREAVTDLQKEDILKDLDKDARDETFGGDSLKITALQENKKAIEEKIAENENRLAELESQRKELFHQTPEGEQEKNEEIKEAIKEKLKESRVHIKPLNFTGMDSLKEIDKTWLEKSVSNLYDEFDRDSVKDVLIDEYSKNIAKYFDTERDRVKNLEGKMEKVKDHEPRQQNEAISRILNNFKYNNPHDGEQFLQQLGFNGRQGLAEIQQAFKEKELKIQEQEQQAMEVINLAMEYRMVGGPDTLSKFEDIDHASKLKSQKQSFELRKKNAENAKYETMSLDTKLHDKLGDNIVLVGSNIQFEGKLDEINQHNKNLDQSIKDLEQELRVADSDYNTEKNKKPWLGKDKHQKKVEQLKGKRDELEQQLQEKRRNEKNIDTNEAFPPIYQYFKELGDSQFNYKETEKFFEAHRSELESGMTLGDLLKIMRKEAEEKEAEEFPQEKQEALDNLQNAEAKLNEAIGTYTQ